MIGAGTTATTSPGDIAGGSTEEQKYTAADVSQMFGPDEDEDTQTVQTLLEAVPDQGRENVVEGGGGGGGGGDTLDPQADKEEDEVVITDMICRCEACLKLGVSAPEEGRLVRKRKARDESMSAHTVQPNNQVEEYRQMAMQKFMASRSRLSQLLTTAASEVAPKTVASPQTAPLPKASAPQPAADSTEVAQPTPSPSAPSPAVAPQTSETKELKKPPIPSAKRGGQKRETLKVKTRLRNKQHPPSSMTSNTKRKPKTMRPKGKSNTKKKIPIARKTKMNKLADKIPDKSPINKPVSMEKRHQSGARGAEAYLLQNTFKSRYICGQTLLQSENYLANLEKVKEAIEAGTITTKLAAIEFLARVTANA